MSTTYTTVGQNIYNYIDAISITAILATGWAKKANYPLKQLDNSQYPAFFVVPAEGHVEELDPIIGDHIVSYWVYLVDTFEDDSLIEDRLRQLVDAVQTQVVKLRRLPNTLHADCTDVEIKGTWGASQDEGERFYRLQLDVHVSESLI